MRMILLQEEDLLYNSFLFASYLPADEILFQALIDFEFWSAEARNQFADWHVTGRQLRHALVYQQVDPFLEEFWLQSIKSCSTKSNHLDLEAKAGLMNAWRGLLWIPPSKEDQAAGRVVSVDRIEKGLLALDNVCVQISDFSFLRRAVYVLSRTYPRSLDFWKEQLGEKCAQWPERLRDAVCSEWPVIQECLAQDHEPVNETDESSAADATKGEDQLPISLRILNAQDAAEREVDLRFVEKMREINNPIGCPASWSENGNIDLKVHEASGHWFS
jgi:hypothetical protein